MNNKNNKEEQLTLELLDAIDKNSEVSQRHLAREMGVALGLANSYLKRCMRKGLVKITSAPANRYLYYLTPKGFSEKSRLTAKYLSYSFTFYRKAGESCRRAYEVCQRNGWDSVLLCGVSDLAEIAALRAIEMDIEIIGVYDPAAEQGRLLHKPVVTRLDDAVADAFLLTDLADPERAYRALCAHAEPGRILVPDILGLPARTD